MQGVALDATDFNIGKKPLNVEQLIDKFGFGGFINHSHQNSLECNLGVYVQCLEMENIVYIVFFALKDVDVGGYLYWDYGDRNGENGAEFFLGAPRNNIIQG